MKKLIFLLIGFFLSLSVIAQNSDTTKKSDYEKYREAKEKGLVKDTVYIHDTIYAEQQQPYQAEENNYSNNYEFGFGFPFFSWYYTPYWYNSFYSPYYYGWNYPYYGWYGYGWNRPYYHRPYYRPHYAPYNRYASPYVNNRPVERRTAGGLITTRAYRQSNYRQNNTQVYERPRVNVVREYNTSRASNYARPSNNAPVNRGNVQQLRPSNNSNYSSGSRSYSAPSSSSRSYSAPSSGGGSRSSSGRR